jgi:hypothetical protein
MSDTRYKMHSAGIFYFSGSQSSFLQCARKILQVYNRCTLEHVNWIILKPIIVLVLSTLQFGRLESPIFECCCFVLDSPMQSWQD